MLRYVFYSLLNFFLETLKIFEPQMEIELAKSELRWGHSKGPFARAIFVAIFLILTHAIESQKYCFIWLCTVGLIHS